jgi:hypothetical protein
VKSPNTRFSQNVVVPVSGHVVMAAVVPTTLHITTHSGVFTTHAEIWIAHVPHTSERLVKEKDGNVFTLDLPQFEMSAILAFDVV